MKQEFTSWIPFHRQEEIVLFEYISNISEEDAWFRLYGANWMKKKLESEWVIRPVKLVFLDEEIKS